MSRILGLLLLVCFSGTAFADAETCALVLGKKLDQAVEKNSEFPEIAVSATLAQHYLLLNQQIDALLVKTHQQMTPEFADKNELLKNLNLKIGSLLTELQKSLRPNLLAKMVSTEKKILLQSGRILEELSACRGAGLLCSADLYKQLEDLRLHETQISQFLTKIQENILSLENLLKDRQDFSPQILGSLARQRESLQIAEATLKAQLDFFKKWINSAVRETENFEGQSNRILKSILPEITKEFPPGTSVVAVMKGPHSRYTTPATILSQEQENVTVRKNKKLIFDQLEAKTSTETVAVIGCYKGICSGDLLNGSGLKAKLVDHMDWPQYESFLDGNQIVVGSNPFTDRVLLKSDSDVYAWVKASEFIAAKSSSP